jgi:16S rRNA (cytosine967-C5)-methyltransferase
MAFDILRRVEDGGYASDLLFAQSKPLDSRDAGLASEIVLGSLRYQAQLDFLIEHFSGRPADRLDPEVRIALRMGIYQLRHLERVPAHAAVSESAELVKRARKRSAVGFVNAVLRKVGREPVAWPDRATELSLPNWILERWERQYGAETAEKIACAGLTTPITYVRTPASDTSRPRIQDIGSQAIVPLLELAPGQSFLDIAAAPGNKTAQAIEAGVRAIACDRHFKRLAPLRELGCDLVVLDGTQSLPFRARFDRILLDAPCSGTGTLARNPEIKWRLRPEDLAGLHARQTAMLANALERLTPGGRLVYSTCSLEREENEDVVAEARGRAVRLWRRLPGIEAGDGFFAAVLTSD